MEHEKSTVFESDNAANVFNNLPNSFHSEKWFSTLKDKSF